MVDLIFSLIKALEKALVIALASKILLLFSACQPKVTDKRYFKSLTLLTLLSSASHCLSDHFQFFVSLNTFEYCIFCVLG